MVTLSTVWTKTLGSSYEVQVSALSVAVDGSIYVGGYTTEALNGIAVSRPPDGVIVKYNSSGEELWTRIISSSPLVTSPAYRFYDFVKGLATGSDGSIYVVTQQIIDSMEKLEASKSIKL